MRKEQKIRTIFSIISLALTALILVFSIFGWYVTNSVATANGITGVSASDDSIQILDTVMAKRYSLNGDITTNTYTKNNDGKLVLVESEIYYESTKTTEEIEVVGTTYFLINEMLPGEHVDITLGYKLNSSKDNENYRVYMKNITADEFVVDTYKHYVTGAFKYKSISLKDKNGNTADDFTPDTNYTWFNSFQIDKNDTAILDKVILNHKWKNKYEELYYTFSIYEDFTQYYQLIAHAQNSYGNLLSKKNFNIGELFLFLG